MALLVAHTRVESGVHTPLQVVAGGVIGALVTLVDLPGVLRMTDAELLARRRRGADARMRRTRSFLVGCAVLARDGHVIEGVNVENAAYPLGVCAERTAFSRAIAEGYRPGDFAVAAITASPCGGCRQWLLEMGVDRVVFRNRRRDVSR